MSILATPANTAQSTGHEGKRRRIDNDRQVAAQRAHPRIFAPFRAIGLVSPTAVPFTVIPLGKKTFQITTCIGRSLHTYDLRRGLNLVFITRPNAPGAITAIAASKNQLLASWTDSQGQNGVWVFERGKKVGELELANLDHDPVLNICVFGAWIVGITSSQVLVWRASSREFHTCFSSSRSMRDANLYSGQICQLPTILDKVFVGRSDGNVDIINVRTGKLVYTILPASANTGPVTALEQAPSYGILAIAYANGLVAIHDVLQDRTICLLNVDVTRGPVTSISFRTDGIGAGDDGQRSGVMATANSNDGDVTLWDLNDGGRIMAVVRDAHRVSSHKGISGGLTKVQFLPGQSVMVTGGSDNNLQSWIFDEAPFSPLPRILHTRGGHGAPISTVRFLPAITEDDSIDGKWLTTGGSDGSLWAWSLRRDGQSSALSQGAHKKNHSKKKGLMNTGTSRDTHTNKIRAPPITCVATCLNRDGGIGAAPGMKTIWDNNVARAKGADATTTSSTGWESVVTGHLKDKFARTWFWGRKRAGRWKFATSDGGTVQSVEVSPCGTFAIIGSSAGAIDCFNLQSGQHRQRFPRKATPSQKRRLQEQAAVISLKDQQPSGAYAPGLGRHTGSVSGLAVDGLNKILCSCGTDGSLKFWEFKTGLLLKELSWPSARALTHMAYNRTSDILAVACDDLSIRLVDIETRKLVRVLKGYSDPISDLCFSPDGRWVVAASGKTIRVWDIPTGHLIEAIRLNSPCNSLAFSPTGEFLATVSPDGLGVNVWTNQSLFMHIPTRQVPNDELLNINLDNAYESNNLLEGAFDAPPEQAPDTALSAVDQLSSQIETLSMVPRSRWQTLLHLDVIRQRNKPKEPPKAPEKAPFFLGSIENGKAQERKTLEEASHKSQIAKIDWTEGHFSQLIARGVEQTNYQPITTYLKGLAPAAADLEIRSLQNSELQPFVQALTSRLKQKMDYELVQVWMSVFLRLHGSEVDPECLVEWREEQAREAERLAALSGYCSGVVGFLRSSRS